MMIKLAIIVPCYNEEEILEYTNDHLIKKLNELISNKLISLKSKIIYVDDGSVDQTWNLIKNFSQTSKNVSGIKLSKNCGHQKALVAGIMSSKDDFDASISIDADLQDDINVFDQFISEFNQGNEIVYGVRNNRKKDSLFKRTTAQLFYKLQHLLGVNIIYNHADFRLLSKKAMNELSKFEESNLFVRGIIPQIGLRSSTVEYTRLERLAGETKYPFKKMISFGLDGITSFSIKPIRLVMSLSFIFVLVSIFMILYSLIRYYDGQTITGWTFLNISIWMIAGIQMFALGIIGEYVGKTYFEVKKRPRYIIEESL